MSDLDCSVLPTDSIFAQSSLNSSNSTISTTHTHSYHADATHNDTDQKIATQQASSTNQTPNSSTPSSLTPTSSGLAEIDGDKDSALRSTLKHLSQQLNVFTFSPLAIDTRSDSSGCTPTPPPSVVSAFRANFLSSNGNHLDESPLSPHNFGHPSSVLHSVFAPSPSNAPFVLSDHFLDERVLSKTIFGQLSLATDLKTGMKVVIKASEQAKMTKRHKGAEIQEDVKKEAIVMRTLGLQKDLAARQPQLAACHIDLSTCGLSDKYIRENSSSTDSNTLSSSALSAIASGRQYLASLIGEYQTPTSHFLATEYATRGDLYSVLTEAQAAGQPLQGEKQARIWFKQLCEGVRYLHALSTAHMDLSVENVCIDSCGNVKIIDLGLAARHPHAHAVTFGSASDIVVNSCHLMSEENDSHFSVGCRCAACWSSHQQLEDRVKDQIHATIKRFPKRVERIIEQSSIKSNLSIHTDDDAIPPSPTHRLDRAESDKHADPSEILASSCKFLFRPVCRQYCKPGKMSYMSIELTDPREFHQPFDGYKADSFSLGVILFILCTGVPPFLKANEYHDTWFRWFITSEWMERRRYTTPVAKHYTQLSPNCWDLIDSIFKPQHIRPSIDEILAHPWFDDQHPLSQPIDRLAKSN